MNSNSRSTKALANIVTVLIYQLVAVVVNIPVRRIFLNSIGVSFLGADSVLISVFGLISLLEFGINGAASYYVLKAIATNDEEKIKATFIAFKRLIFVVTCITVLVSLTIFFVLPTIISFSEGTQNLIYYAFILYLVERVIALQYLYNYAIVFYYQDSYYVNLLNIALDIIFCFVFFLFINIQINYLHYVLLLLIKNFVRYFFVKRKAHSYITSKSVSKESINTQKNNILTYTKKNMINHVVSIIYTFKDNLIASSLLGVKGLVKIGMLSNYTAVVAGITGLASGMIISISASISNYLNDASIITEENIILITKRALFLSFVIVCFSVCGLLGLTNQFIGLFYGHEYVLEGIYILIMVLNLIAVIFSQTLDLLISSKGLAHLHTRYSIIILVVSFSVAYFLTISYGILGIVISTFVANMIKLIVEFILIYQNITKSVFSVLKDLMIYYGALIMDVILISSILKTSDFTFNGLVINGISISIIFFGTIGLFSKKREFKFYIDFIIRRTR